jgi:hypothetical protein
VPVGVTFSSIIMRCARLGLMLSALGRSRADDPDADHRLLHGHPLRAAAVRRGACEPRLPLVLPPWAGRRCEPPACRRSGGWSARTRLPTMPYASGFLADFTVAVGRNDADAVVERTKCHVCDLSCEWMSWLGTPLSRVPTGPIRISGDIELRWRCENDLGLHPTSAKATPGSATMGSLTERRRSICPMQPQPSTGRMT